LLVYGRPNLLLLDEPANHLDLEMRQALAQALQDFDGAMVLVSHDRHLLRMCCDELLLVHDGSVEPFAHSLDDYPQWLAARTRQAQDTASPNGGRSAAGRRQQKREEAEQRRRLQPLRDRVASAEQALEDAHAARAELESRLADTGLYTDDARDRLKSLLLEKAEIDGRCERLEQDWLEASEALEAQQESG
jgi:ATP-binding cassette subfamily F protein 3